MIVEVSGGGRSLSFRQELSGRTCGGERPYPPTSASGRASERFQVGTSSGMAVVGRGVVLTMVSTHLEGFRAQRRGKKGFGGGFTALGD